MNCALSFIHLSVSDSTSSYLRSVAASLAPFTVVSAEYQTGGRGRGANRWECPRNGGALFSMLLPKPPGCPMSAAEHLSLLAAETIAGWLRRKYRVGAIVKPPNDVLVGGRKICGILLEEVGDHLILGVGLNTNLDASTLSVDQAVVSLRNLTGGEFDNRSIVEELACELLTGLDYFKPSSLTGSR